MDCFSRKAMIYKKDNKCAENIVKDILDFCLHNGFPKEFVSDNGPEFKNKYLNEICIKEGITFIHGVTYNPLTQGMIERFHYTIKKYLGKEYINNCFKSLNFDEIRIKIMNFYNNKMHRIIECRQMKLQKITNENDIIRINYLKDQVFAKINRKRSYLRINDTCLLNPKFLIVGKHTLIPNFVKKGKINEKIPVRILKNSSYGYYHIKICANYKSKRIRLKCGDDYICDSKLLKKISEKAWKAIVSH